MRSSSEFESSSQCKPSPDGRWIATLGSSSVLIRSIKTLRIINVVELDTPVSNISSATLLWAPSSTRLLVSTSDQIDVYGAGVTSGYHATIRNPLGSGGKPAIVQFGARDTEIFVYPASGLKLVIFDLSTSTAVEIANPKFSQAPFASRGLSIRPGTGHLALLTRIGGKDLISLHDPLSRQVQKCWGPDTADAQGLTWVPNGQWLLVWETPIQGHRIQIFTADGQHFRTLGAANLLTEPNADLELGIKLCQLSPDASMCVLGDHSRGVAVIRTDAWRASLRLLHPTIIVPRDNCQVWQEQIAPSSLDERSTHAFVKATQLLSPPGLTADGRPSADLKPGCSMAAFDASSTLLATRLDDSPCTLWIWDVAAAELRAVLIFHNSSVGFQWHPTCRELLLVTIQDAAQHGMAFIWDPLSEGPTAIALDDFLPNGKAMGGGRTQVIWVDASGPESPVLLASNARHYVMLSPLSPEQGPGPWQLDEGQQWSDEDVEEKVTEAQTPARSAVDDKKDDDDEEEEEGKEEDNDDDDEDAAASDVEDTFIFKRIKKGAKS